MSGTHVAMSKSAKRSADTISVNPQQKIRATIYHSRGSRSRRRPQESSTLAIPRNIESGALDGNTNQNQSNTHLSAIGSTSGDDILQQRDSPDIVPLSDPFNFHLFSDDNPTSGFPSSDVDVTDHAPDLTIEENVPTRPKRHRVSQFHGCIFSQSVHSSFLHSCRHSRLGYLYGKNIWKHYSKMTLHPPPISMCAPPARLN